MKPAFAVFSAALMALLLLGGCTQPSQPLPPDSNNSGTDTNAVFPQETKYLEITIPQPVGFDGEPFNFSVKNLLNEPVFLPGCNEFALEKFSDGNWQQENKYLKNCLWEGNAVKLAAGETKNFMFHADENGFSAYRISIDASIGCAESKPISTAGCTGMQAIKSGQFFLGTRQTGADANMACNLESDCQILDAGCCGCSQGGKRIVLNKEFATQFIQSLDCGHKQIACPQVISTDPSCNQNNHAVCNMGKCGIGYPL